ncbi:MAG: FHA domain-containing protein, partial [Eggerthellaceae bacterium]|nr:FHA domain-containing protein [Eggerthellaceae bacterium]
MDSLENKVEDAKRNAAAANAAAANASSAAVNAAKVSAASAASASAARQASAAPAARPAANATIIDRTPQAATIIDVPKTGDTLTIQAGSNRGNTYDLPANDFVIGREAKCYIVVDDGKVSREHVKFVYTSGSWSALDMGSVNGTYINGQRLSGQQQLNNGDTVKIGDTILVFGKAAH